MGPQCVGRERLFGDLFAARMLVPAFVDRRGTNLGCAHVAVG
jgi:hypothetical protein